MSGDTVGILKTYHQSTDGCTNGAVFPVETEVFFDGHRKDPPEFHFHWNPVLKMDGFYRITKRKQDL
jgi:hypothetical protein